MTLLYKISVVATVTALIIVSLFCGCGSRTSPPEKSSLPEISQVDLAEAYQIFDESLLEETEAVLYTDFDETWYLVSADSSDYARAVSILQGVRGEKIDFPEDFPAGSYEFRLKTASGWVDCSSTSDGSTNYASIGGELYLVTENFGPELAEYCRSVGESISKDTWSHDAAYLRPEMYFWKNSGISGTAETICYAETPWATEVGYTGDEIPELSFLPEFPDYSDRELDVYYNQDGSVWELLAIWQDYDESDSSNYRQLILRIWPEKPETADGLISFRTNKLTLTEIRDFEGNMLKVYGDGTDQTNAKYLLFSLSDGSWCQIEAVSAVPMSDLAEVLKSLVSSAPDYDVLPVEYR